LKQQNRKAKDDRKYEQRRFAFDFMVFKKEVTDDIIAQNKEEEKGSKVDTPT